MYRHESLMSGCRCSTSTRDSHLIEEEEEEEGALEWRLKDKRYKRMDERFDISYKIHGLENCKENPLPVRSPNCGVSS